MNQVFQLPIQVRFCDLDAVGHINNSIYHQYIELARTHFCDHALGYKIHSENEFIPIVLARTELDFLQQTFLHDKIVVHTWVGHIGNSSFHQISEMHTPKGIVAKSKSILVWFDYEANKSVPIPSNIQEKLKRFTRNSQ